MYNENQKYEYIKYSLETSIAKSKDKMKKNMESFFNNIEPSEEQLGKDVAMFDDIETKALLSKICSHASNYKRQTILMLSAYMAWCVELRLSLDGENRIVAVTPDNIDTAKKDAMSMVRDEEALEEKLNIGCRSLQEDTVDNRVRAVFHLLFNGIPFNDIFELKKSDVDTSKKEIRLSNRTVKLSKKCSEIVKYVMEMEYITGSPIDNKGRKKGSVRTYQIVQSEYVVENSIGDRNRIKGSFRTLASSTFRKIKEARDEPIASIFNDILLSGVFARTYEQEKKTGTNNVIKFAEEVFSDHFNTYTVENGYSKWKKAFSLE